LRILRALRFSCQLKFTIDQDTKAAIFKFKDLLVNISNERIAIEINKMLLSDITIVLEEYLSVFQVIFPELDKSSISEKIGRLRRSEENLIVRTAILFYDFKDPEKAIDFLKEKFL
jgi:tRNA nucleotidyltransferase (CCA-adding enzyme)